MLCEIQIPKIVQVYLNIYVKLNVLGFSYLYYWKGWSENSVYKNIPTNQNEICVFSMKFWICVKQNET